MTTLAACVYRDEARALHEQLLDAKLQLAEKEAEIERLRRGARSSAAEDIALKAVELGIEQTVRDWSARGPQAVAVRSAWTNIRLAVRAAFAEDESP